MAVQNDINLTDMNAGSILTKEPESLNQGYLQIQVLTYMGNRPISGAVVRISYTGNPTDLLEEVFTNADGTTGLLTLASPPLAYSMEPEALQPYAEYTIEVQADGYETVVVSGTNILPTIKSIQRVYLRDAAQDYEDIVIGPNTLYGNYPAKIPEAEIKPVNESGEIVLNKVVVPEYIVVHDGAPNDTTAQNYWVRYKDYIKNVASSEIYATWPKNTIRANVLAIMSFTLNRVYTEWYRNHQLFVVGETI